MDNICKGHYKNGTNCTAKAKIDGYCKRHFRQNPNYNAKKKEEKNTGFFLKKHAKQIATAIIFLIGLIADIGGSWSTLVQWHSKYWEGEIPIVCDRGVDLGCTIDMVASNPFIMGDLPFNSSIKPKTTSVNMRVGIGVPWVVNTYEYMGNTYTKNEKMSPIIVKSGKRIHTKNVNYNISNNAQETIFPYIQRKDGKLGGPFVVSKKGFELQFRGELKEFKTGNLLGWFNGDEFGIVEPCGYSWNQDSVAIEMVDRNGQVSFFVEYNNDILEYRGYFKLDKKYYIYNDKEYITDDEDEAERLILDIPKVFQHHKEGHLGVRL